MPELIKCVKCPEKGDYYGVDPKRAIYCKECFLKMVHRKFSYCLGKRHIFKEATAESALLVNTGDETSALLISLIRDGLATEQTSKRLRIEPLMLYLFTTDDMSVIEEEIERFNAARELFNGQKWAFYFVHAASVLDKGISFSGNEDEVIGGEQISEYMNLLKSIKDRSIREEIKRLLNAELIVRISRQLGCRKVVMPENAEKLANISFTALCLGRGAAVAELTDVVDERLSDVNFIRPLRDICNREVRIYHELKGTSACLIGNPSDGNSKPQEGIQRLSMEFIDSLQCGGFPGTVATILSMSSKLEHLEVEDESSINEDNGSLVSICRLCYMKIRKSSDSFPTCSICENVLEELNADVRHRLISCY